jgi:hypothetical protein
VIGSKLFGIEEATIPTVTCRTCGKTHQMGHCSPAEYPYCDDKCRLKFERVVEGIATGVPLDLLGAKPGSRLWLEAEKEISRIEARGLWQARAGLEIDYYETLPRRRASVAKRYFSS